MFDKIDVSKSNSDFFINMIILKYLGVNIYLTFTS